MPHKTLEDLFIHELSDVYSAEKQLTRALPKLARAAADSGLADAFRVHLDETHGQIERIDQAVSQSGLKMKRIKCAAMEGLVEEGQDLIDMIDKGLVLDVALIGAAQRVEHYEIASYSTLCLLADRLGHKEAARLLKETLAEETATSKKLDSLAQAMKIEASPMAKAA